jgi:hypothetical protein
MARCQLRIYNGPADQTLPTLDEGPTGRRNVTMSVGDILPLLADAVESRRTWLRDFEDDEITISTDLYEVLLAYQHYCRPGA